jgi:hypothetical protein
LINLFGGKFKGYGALKLRVNLCRGGRKGDAGENLRVLLQSANTTESLESSGVGRIESKGQLRRLDFSMFEDNPVSIEENAEGAFMR